MGKSIAGTLPPPRRVGLRALRSGDGALLDRALVLCFPASGSATGEDLIELHCHGGPAVVDAVEAALLVDGRARRAMPGEFTRHALENGRIDLLQAQGLADLLEAETETQRRLAIAASEGHVSRVIEGWIDRLIAMAAQVEASIDYGEEGDVVAEAAALDRIDGGRRALAAEIAALLETPAVERWRDGIRVVLAGPPNAGKSTLVNALAGRDAAIVSPIAGTTRDRVEVPVRRGGMAYVLTDTAGLREDGDDPVERIGIDLARGAVRTADLVLWLGDEAPADAGWMHVHARADEAGRGDAPRTAAVSTQAGDPGSIERLWQLVEQWTRRATPTLALHRHERDRCLACLTALDHVASEPELVAEHLRAAHSALSGMLTAEATDTMLDHLFSRFCVGK